MSRYLISHKAGVQMSSLTLQNLKLKYLGFPGGSHGKASACNEGDLDSIPGLGRSTGEGNGNPL